MLVLVPAVGLLLLLGMLYMRKAERPQRHTAHRQQYWFPLLGQPTDPLQMPLPIGEEWAARGIWMLHLCMPLIIAHLAFWENFRLGTPSIGPQPSLLSWLLAFGALVIWGATLSITNVPHVKSPFPRWVFGVGALASLLFYAGAGLATTASGSALSNTYLGGGTIWGPKWAAWTWLQCAVFWLPSLLWGTAWAFRRVSRFCLAALAVMSVAIFLNFGQTALVYWSTLSFVHEPIPADLSGRS